MHALQLRGRFNDLVDLISIGAEVDKIPVILGTVFKINNTYTANPTISLIVQ